MRATNMKKAIVRTQLLLAAHGGHGYVIRGFRVCCGSWHHRAKFRLAAAAAYLNQPDGQAVYSWGYGCAMAHPATIAPANLTDRTFCNTMQVPGPTLIVTEGQPVTVALTNSLPNAAGNTSILFPGVTLSAFTDGDARAAHSGSGARSDGDLSFHRALRPAHALTTAEPRAICRSRWVCTARSSCFRKCPRCLHVGHWEVFWRPTALPSLLGAKRISGCSRRPTITQTPATTASIYSSSPRWIPNSHAGRSAGPCYSGEGWLHRRRCRMQPGSSDRALPPGIFPDQRPLYA